MNDTRSLSRRKAAAFLGALGLVACSEAVGEGSADPSAPGAKTIGLPATGTAASGLLSARDFGATGDGVTDDTAALQRAIDAAQTTGALLLIPAGNYLLTDTLRITAHVRIVGAGYQGDVGRLYKSEVVTQTNGFLGTTLLPSAAKTAIQIVTNDAVQLSDFMIMWPQPRWPTAYSGIAGIQVQATDGRNANTASVFERLCIYGADRGMVFVNCSAFAVLTCTFLMSQTYGIVVTTLAGPQVFQNGGDWLVEGSTFFSGSATFGGAAAIYTTSTAGKILGNKIQPSAGSGRPQSGILVVPDPTVPGRMVEPMIISGNSIEGNAVGIHFYQNEGSDALATLALVTANQIWCSTAVKIESRGTRSISGLPLGVWVVGLTITGNVMQTQHDPANVDLPLSCIELDGVLSATITGNTFSSTGGTAARGVTLHAHTHEVNVQSNAYVSSIATKVANAGTNNALGGGSM